MTAAAAVQIQDDQKDQSDTTGDAKVIDLHPGGSLKSTTKQRDGMSDEHKEALANGRNQSRAVKAYLAALKDSKPKRGRKRTAESIQVRLAKIADELPNADALQEVLLLQEQVDLEKELATLGSDVDLSELEAGFIAVGLAYSASKGIDYTTWRKVGVPAETLGKAGIKR